MTFLYFQNARLNVILKTSIKAWVHFKMNIEMRSLCQAKRKQDNYVFFY